MLRYSYLQPSEIDKLPYYELEELLDSLKKLAEQEEEERKKKEKTGPGSNFDMNSAMRQMRSSMNSSGMNMPSFPKMKL